MVNLSYNKNLHPKNLHLLQDGEVQELTIHIKINMMPGIKSNAEIIRMITSTGLLIKEYKNNGSERLSRLITNMKKKKYKKVAEML